MITLASVIERFEADYLAQYQNAILPSQRHALAAMKRCRSSAGVLMLAKCTACNEQRFVPHSCGQRNCPHCQHFESQRWIERQTGRLVAGSYFLITFTLPAELRGLAWGRQRTVYDRMMQCAWCHPGQAAHLQSKPQAAARHPRRGGGAAHAFAPTGVSPACACGDACGGAGC